jgi:hypothetical protein
MDLKLLNFFCHYFTGIAAKTWSRLGIAVKETPCAEINALIIFLNNRAAVA